MARVGSASLFAFGSSRSEHYTVIVNMVHCPEVTMQSLAGAKTKASFTLQDNNYGTSYEQIITEDFLNRIHNTEEMDIGTSRHHFNE